MSIGVSRLRHETPGESAGIPSLIGVARDTAVENFVYISSASAHADSPVEFFRLKFEAERLLRTSGLPYSILRPTHLMDTWVEMLTESITKQGKTTVFGSGTNPVSWVAGKDVAKVAAALAMRPGEGWSADLGGPEALPLTKVNELIAASLGLKIKGENRMPVGMLRVMRPLTRPFNAVLARRMQMGALLDTQSQIVDSSTAWARFGEPMSLSTWLEINHPSGWEGV
ncbi:NAD(P)H-binding protein [Nonomuraea sp. NPDC003201]